MKFKSEVQLEALNNAAVDTDKFLVSDSSTVKYRTGAQVLSDIGGQAALTNPITGTGTTNYVSKFTGSTTLGNSLLFDNGTNVGIGTTSPAGKLSLYDTTDVWLNVTRNSSFVNIGVDSTGTFYNTNSNHRFVYNSGSNEAMRITSSGSVGIGTTSPGSPLDVQCNSSALGINIRQRSGNDFANLVFSNTSNTGLGSVGYVGTNRLRFTTNGLGDANEKLSILSNGNVGIGTSSPTFSAGGGLQVVRSDHANVRVTGGSSLGLDLLQSTDGTGYLRNRDNAQLRLGTNNVDVITMTNTGNVGIGTTSPTGKLQVNSFNSSNNALTIQASNHTSRTYGVGIDSASSLSFYDNFSAVARMVINSSGNVGIGTTSPSYKLDISADNNRARILGTTGYVLLDLQNNPGSFYIGRERSTGGAIIAGSAAYSGVVNLQGNYPLYLGTNGAIRATITGAGNVGIGTTSPGAKLEVVSSTAANTAPISIVSNSNSYGAWLKYAQGNSYQWYTGITSGSDFVIDDVNIGTTRLIVKNTSGNVGIGTTSPGTKLDVAGDVFINSNYTGANTAANDLTIGKTTTGDHGITIATGPTYSGSIYFGDSDNNDAGSIGYQHSVNSMKFTTNRFERMRITSTGNVGIGITAPASKFHVYQNDTLIDQTAGITIEQGGTGDAILQYLQTGAYRWVTGIDNSDGDKFKIGRGISWGLGQDLTIDTTGNVGIGTTSPDQKLVVSGTTNIYSKVVTSGVDSTLGINLVNDARSWVVRVDGADGDKFQIRDASAGAQRITIDTSGNVGIGTTSPAEKLEVVGNIFLDALGSTLEMGNGGGGKFGSIGFNNSTNNVEIKQKYVNGGIIFNTNTSSERMRITSSGNVGIGTSNPLAKLDIVTPPTGFNRGMKIGPQTATDGDGTYIEFTASSTDGFGPQIGGIRSGAGGLGDLIIRTGGNTQTERFRVTNAGNVGIGTTTPSSLLAVGGSGEPAAFSVSGISGINTIATFRDIDGENVFLTAGKISDSSIDIVFGDVNSAYGLPYYRINSDYHSFMDGNVGIGTDSPNAILDVAGDASINRVTIGQGPAVGQQNTALGKGALSSMVYGSANIAIGDSCNTDNDAAGLTTIGVELNTDTNLDPLNQDCLAISQYNSNTYSNQVPHIYAPKPIAISSGATNIITFDVNHYAGAIVEYMIRLDDGDDYALGTVYMGWKSSGTGNMIDVRQIEYSDMSGFVFSLGGSGQTLVLTNTSGNNAWIRITVRGMMTN